MKVKCPYCGREFEVEETKEFKQKMRRFFYAGYGQGWDSHVC